MNIVFWLFIIIILALVWLTLSFSFKGVGSFFKGVFEDTLDDIKDEHNPYDDIEIINVNDED